MLNCHLFIYLLKCFYRDEMRCLLVVQFPHDKLSSNWWGKYLYILVVVSGIKNCLLLCIYIYLLPPYNLCVRICCCCCCCCHWCIWKWQLGLLFDTCVICLELSLCWSRLAEPKKFFFFYWLFDDVWTVHYQLRRVSILSWLHEKPAKLGEIHGTHCLVPQSKEWYVKICAEYGLPASYI